MINELAKSSTFELLQALILSNNFEAEQIDKTDNQLINALSTINDQLLTIEQNEDQLLIQNDTLDKQEKEINGYKTLLLEAEKIAQHSTAQSRELSIAKSKVAELQKMVAGMGNVQKTNRLVKAQKAKAVERNARIEVLEKNAKLYRIDAKEDALKLKFAIEKIKDLNKQLDHNQGAGIYHKGEHHLTIWPEVTKIKRLDGSIFESRSLLYLHQSGCAKLVTFDPVDNAAVFCQMPKGGLRPSKEIKEFATNWLFTVNNLQDGIVEDKDMVSVNYNVEYKDKA